MRGPTSYTSLPDRNMSSSSASDRVVALLVLDMTQSDCQTIVALNDRVLERLVVAGDDASEREIGRLIVEIAQPVIEQILARYVRTGAIPHQDAGDVAGTVHLRLVEKLRRVRTDPEECIHDFARYVATLTYNGVNDQLRRRFPERARLKNRLRYTLGQDPRLALWDAGPLQACGFAEWSGALAVGQDVPVEVSAVTRSMRHSDRPGDALAAIFAAAGGPVSFDALVRFTATIWHVVDLPLMEAEAGLTSHNDSAARLESREFLRALWDEIRQLRPLQRKALLLNLRDAETVNVVSLLMLTRVARFDDLAAALDMTPDGLAAIWHDLPLDDRRIAELIQTTRQQVINLRKSARERLSRRLKR